MGAGESSIISSSPVGVDPGVGDVISMWAWLVKNGCLCGNGETSMSSV